jgi:hypothetical protein
MIVTRIGGQSAVVYDTGEDHGKAGRTPPRSPRRAARPPHSRNGGPFPAIPTSSASTAGISCEGLYESAQAAALRFVVASLCPRGSPSAAKDAPRSFSLSTTRTFAPGESVKIQLLARNVPSLEFRVYRVNDAEKFFAGLKDLHSFGVTSNVPRRANRPENLA